MACDAGVENIMDLDVDRFTTHQDFSSNILASFFILRKMVSDTQGDMIRKMCLSSYSETQQS